MIIKPDEYYSVHQAAQHFGVKHFTIRDWIRKGKLKSIKIGDTQQAPVRILGAEILKLSGGNHGISENGVKTKN